MGCYSLSVCHICNFFQYILVPQTQKETKRNCVRDFVKLIHCWFFFTVMINCVLSINFIFIYLQIKAIIVVKKKETSQILNIINIRFPHYLAASFPLLFYWETVISSFLLKLREHVCYFSDIS